MSKVFVRTIAGQFTAELDDSDVSNAIWLSESVPLTANMLGGMIYCELPLRVQVPEGERTTELDVGDVAYWPGPGAICFFFGPTPLSGEDGRPVAPRPVVKIGRMVGDCSGLEGAGDRQKITLVPTFRSRDQS